MKTLHILILEDNIDDAQNIINLLSQEYSITLANTLVKAKEAAGTSTFDLAIIDIGINGKLDGIEFAKYLQQVSASLPYLFLTSMQSKTVFNEAKLTKPFTYLLKPFNAIELQYTIELALEKYYAQEDTLRINNKSILSPEYLFIKKGNKICKVVLEDIDYVEVDNNYCTICCGNLKKYAVKLSLAKVKDLVQNKSFIQIHRKYIVNLNRVKEISLNDNSVILHDEIILTISERYKKQFSKNQIIIS